MEGQKARQNKGEIEEEINTTKNKERTTGIYECKKNEKHR